MRKLSQSSSAAIEISVLELPVMPVVDDVPSESSGLPQGSEPGKPTPTEGVPRLTEFQLEPVANAFVDGAPVASVVEADVPVRKGVEPGAVETGMLERAVEVEAGGCEESCCCWAVAVGAGGGGIDEVAEGTADEAKLPAGVAWGGKLDGCCCWVCADGRRQLDRDTRESGMRTKFCCAYCCCVGIGTY